ncbi:MAG: hypothetical protein GEU78_19470 [Actinobacteria bacterium]|nr:hypothetical protein [Actinomycetota bacterium]
MTNSFIAAETVSGALHEYYGDDRGFDPLAHPDRSRFSLTLDFELGVGSFQVTPTCSVDGQCWDPLPLGEGNEVDVARDEQLGAVVVEYALANPGERLGPIRSPSIDGRLTVFTRDPSGQIGLLGSSDSYPSTEVYQIRGGQVTALAQADETHPRGLFPPMTRTYRYP